MDKDGDGGWQREAFMIYCFGMTQRRGAGYGEPCRRADVKLASNGGSGHARHGARQGAAHRAQQAHQ